METLEEVEEVDHDPNLGFRALLSKWQTQDKKEPAPDKASRRASYTGNDKETIKDKYVRRKSRWEAKQDKKEKDNKQQDGGGGGGGNNDNKNDNNNNNNNNSAPGKSDQQQNQQHQPKKAKKNLMPKNVYQKPLKMAEAFRPPVFEKNEEEVQLISAALSKNFVFSDMTGRDLSPLVYAFERCEFREGDTVIRQGDPGDYFYIIENGVVVFEVNGTVVGKAGKGASFGELALLYTCPRAASVICNTEALLFRVDQTTFRFILESQTKQSESDKISLLRGVNFLKDLTSGDLKKLSSVMTPRVFKKDEVLVRKGEPGDAFYIMQEGQCLVCDISVGATTYEDQTLGPGEYFGERALATSEPRAANVKGLTQGIAFSIDRDTFEKVLGKMSKVIMRAQDVRRLAGIKMFKKAHLDERQLASLANLIHDHSYKAGKTVIKQSQKKKAAICFVREGRIHIQSEDGKYDEVVEAGGFFGQELILKQCTKARTTVHVPYEVVAKQDSVCGVLTLADLRTVFDTNCLAPEHDQALLAAGARTDRDKLRESQLPFEVKPDQFAEHEAAPGPGEEVEDLDTDGARKCNAALHELTRHKILGEGTFGQVWLVTDETAGEDHRPYALKIQIKSELASEGQVKAVVREKQIMTQLNHPFLIDLVKTYQDENFLYILLDFIQGGELFSIVHHEDGDGMPESQAKFYALGIADALAYMHRRKLVFRDLKPENVMIDAQGYPIVIDFGFAKHVPDKTYTLCGTPGYLPPEVVMTRGHNSSADHWSLGILIYEMITGENPFYFEGMDQMSLFQSIVQDDYEPPLETTAEAADIIAKLLVKDPSHRLGSLARGEYGIFEHKWFEEVDIRLLRRRQLKAPWRPVVKDIMDTGCFDEWDDLEDVTTRRFPRLKEADAALFQSF